MFVWQTASRQDASACQASLPPALQSEALHTVMPPRPFPLPFRIGNDICSIKRVHAIIEPRPGDLSSPARPPLKRFISKLLTWPERNYFYKRFPCYKDVVGEDLQALTKVSYYLAGR